MDRELNGACARTRARHRIRCAACERAQPGGAAAVPADDVWRFHAAAHRLWARRHAPAVAAALADAWGDEETLVLVSSDLSHYLSYDEARATDDETITAILRNEATLTGEQACGCIGINGLTFLARQRVARASTRSPVATRRHGRRSSVGSGATARSRCTSLLHDSEPEQRSELLSLARMSIEASLPTGERAPYSGPPLHADLNRQGASFVTLRVGDDLRGCCGTIEASRPCTSMSGTTRRHPHSPIRDFPALTLAEWNGTGIEISVLSEPRAM